MFKGFRSSGLGGMTSYWPAADNAPSNRVEQISLRVLLM